MSQDNFFSDFEKTAKRTTRWMIAAGIVMSAASLLFVGALIYFVFWCLKHFGIIG